jgi:alpha-2-macroglobulin
VGVSVKNPIRFVRQVLKPWRFFVLALLMVSAIVFSHPLNIEPGLSATPSASPPPALSNPKLPGWIEQISPTGKAAPLAQIRIRFKNPLIPLEQLESNSQQKLLQQFELNPALPGQFRFLTPRMVGFQADQVLPNATQVKVILKAGLADLKQHQLSQDLAWTFQTEPIQLQHLPGSTADDSSVEFNPLNLQPELQISANTKLNLSSLAQSASLISQTTQQRIALRAVLKRQPLPPPPNPDLSNYADPNEAFITGRLWDYVLIPQKKLAPETRYRLEISPGLRSAHGNLVSEKTFKSYMKTYGPLAYQKLTFRKDADGVGINGRFVKGDPLLHFNNPLEFDSVAANLTISPTPLKAENRIWTTDNRVIGFNPWLFEPDKTYTITLGKNLKDIYGQTLGKPVIITYQPGDFSPALSVPTNFKILPIGIDLPLTFSSINLPDGEYQASYRVLQRKDLINVDLNDIFQTNAYINKLLPSLLADSRTWERFKLSRQTPNQPQEIVIPLREKLGSAPGILAYGIKARIKSVGKHQESITYGVVQTTNLGIFTQKFPRGGFVRVHHLADGSIAPGVTIEVYPSFPGRRPEGSQTVDHPCTRGITNQSGTFTFEGEALQQCAHSSDLLVIARENKDWAFVNLGNLSYGYGVYWDGLSKSGESRGTIFSDRSLYQPGETAWFTGAAYHLRQGVLQQDQKVPYNITISSPMGEDRDLGRQITNEFGMFTIKVDLSPDQNLGNYRLRATAPNGDAITGEFRVAEFKPPNIKVALGLDQEFVASSQTVTAAVQSNYLFGTPVSGGNANFSVRRQTIPFTPKGWDEFAFGRRSFWPELQPSINEGVLNNNVVLDAKGQGTQLIKIADALPFAMTYQVNTEVKDSANTAVADSKSFIALPSDRLIGLQNDFNAAVKKPIPIKVIVTDPTGQAIAGNPVQVELQKIDYRTQDAEGRGAKNSIAYTTVDKVEVTPASSPQTVQLTPPNAGSYRIRANFVAAKNENTATDQQIWATGTEPISWDTANGNTQHKLYLNPATYKPGDTATVSIQSPYPEAKLYLSVVRHRVLYQTVMTVQGNAPQVQFPITAEMLPNAAVQTVLVRQGAPLSQVALGQLKNLVSIGFAPFDVTLKGKTLNVAIAPDQPTIPPQGTQTVNLTLQDPQGKPIQGQFTVMVVNESVLQLTGYRAPNLVDVVYAKQNILTRFNDNRSEVLLQPLQPPAAGMEQPAPEPAPIMGLDGGGGGPPARIRRDFRALAYYNGSVLTDPQGRARISFTVPDDLTTWRIMAVATDGKLRFGSNDVTFLAAKPLMANPVLPQFARPGDRFAAGLSITPTPNPKGTLTVDGSLSGAATFTSPAKLQTPAPTTTQTYRFPVTALQPGTAEVRFSAQLGKHTDAFAVPLSVKPHAVTEQVVETGTTTTQTKIPLNVGEKVEPSVGGLDISLSSTLIPVLIAPTLGVLAQNDLPFLEPTASQLAIAAHLKTLSRQDPQSFTHFDPDAQATIALKQLQTLQNTDGGFTAQPRQEAGQAKSAPLLSAYAVQSLTLAQKTGIPVDSKLLSDAKSYLEQILVNPAPEDPCKEPRCQAEIRLQTLLALADVGNLHPNAIASIYALRDQLAVATQLKLAGYLSRLPNRQTEAAALSEQLQEILNQRGRSATLNLPQYGEWFSSRTVAQAEMLRLQIAQKASADLQDRTLRGLLALRRDGTWGSTYDNAQALAALVAYSKQQPAPPKFQAIAQLANKTLLSQTFAGYQPTSVEKKIPMQDLPRGRHDLVLQKSGEGTLHYLTTYRYQPQGVQPGRLNGLRVTRTLRPVNQNTVVQRIGLTPTPQPIALKAGEVFEVGVEVIADHPVDHVLITDPLPAGLEALDTSFQTTSTSFQTRGDSWDIAYEKTYKDRIVAYGDRLDAGVYVMHYLVRAVTPGLFQWPGAEVQLQYAPEEFGRSSTALLRVSSQENGEGTQSLPQS